MEKTITNSSRTCFLDCPFRYFLEYVRRLSPLKSKDYFVWGSLVHSCEEKVDNDLPVEEAIEEFRAETEARGASSSEIEQLDEMCLLAPRVIDAHMLKWHGSEENYETLGGEKAGGKFSMPLPSGWLFEGKIDKFIRDTRTGRILIRERKTAARTNEAFWSAKTLDSQPQGYCLGAQRCMGLQVNHVQYDIYGKPQIRQKKGQTREEFLKELADVYLLKHKELFERRTIPYTPKQIQAYYWDINSVSRMIEWCLLNAEWPKHHPGNRFGICDFLPVCERGDESKFYMREKQHPEI